VIARRQASRVADRLLAAARETGYIPTIVGGHDEPANLARVLPVVEGLAHALFGAASDAPRGDGEYGGYISALARHDRAALAGGARRYPDGGWKLTSADDNSLLSKVPVRVRRSPRPRAAVGRRRPARRRCPRRLAGKRRARGLGVERQILAGAI
jgi:hypothetical protein